jgi:hypothetical protein
LSLGGMPRTLFSVRAICGTTVTGALTIMSSDTRTCRPGHGLRLNEGGGRHRDYGSRDSLVRIHQH